jgi:phosphate starvation-inducible PhoH-like protein
VTRIGAGSQVIINGDTDQSDLPTSSQRLEEVADRLKAVPGVSVFWFTDSDIVRHSIIGPILRGLAK